MQVLKGWQLSVLKFGVSNICQTTIEAVAITATSHTTLGHLQKTTQGHTQNPRSPHLYPATQKPTRKSRTLSFYPASQNLRGHTEPYSPTDDLLVERRIVRHHSKLDGARQVSVGCAWFAAYEALHRRRQEARALELGFDHLGVCDAGACGSARPPLRSFAGRNRLEYLNIRAEHIK